MNMGETRAELAIDVLEVLVAGLLILAYVYVRLIENQRIHDPIVEGLVVTAGLVMFGDQYQEHFNLGS